MATPRRLGVLVILVATTGVLAGCGSEPATDSDSRYRIVVQDFTNTTVTNTTFRDVESVPEPVREVIKQTENSTELRNESSMAVSEERFRETLDVYHNGTVPDTLASEYKHYIEYQNCRYLIEFNVLKE